MAPPRGAVNRYTVRPVRRDFVWHDGDPAGRNYEIVLAPPGSMLDLGPPRWNQSVGARLVSRVFWPIVLPLAAIRWALATRPLRSLLGRVWRVVVVEMDQTPRWDAPRVLREEFASEDAARARVHEIRESIARGEWGAP